MASVTMPIRSRRPVVSKSAISKSTPRPVPQVISQPNAVGHTPRQQAGRAASGVLATRPPVRPAPTPTQPQAKTPVAPSSRPVAQAPVHIAAPVQTRSLTRFFSFDAGAPVATGAQGVAQCTIDARFVPTEIAISDPSGWTVHHLSVGGVDLIQGNPGVAADLINRTGIQALPLEPGNAIRVAATNGGATRPLVVNVVGVADMIGTAPALNVTPPSAMPIAPTRTTPAPTPAPTIAKPPAHVATPPTPPAITAAAASATSSPISQAPLHTAAPVITASAAPATAPATAPAVTVVQTPGVTAVKSTP